MEDGRHGADGGVHSAGTNRRCAWRFFTELLVDADADGGRGVDEGGAPGALPPPDESCVQPLRSTSVINRPIVFADPGVREGQEETPHPPPASLAEAGLLSTAGAQAPRYGGVSCFGA
ncbi:unnamed protein product [Rangifer tarandus platyrhynchus]|uniref:Uncharacterized protein n=1 Tax=Rangifer tarandus platyrhynchus TaxID=3082113 RepID=A0ACB1KFW3_RANTA